MGLKIINKKNLRGNLFSPPPPPPPPDYALIYILHDCSAVLSCLPSQPISKIETTSLIKTFLGGLKLYLLKRDAAGWLNGRGEVESKNVKTFFTFNAKKHLLKIYKNI